jgi:hypothetical protein
MKTIFPTVFFLFIVSCSQEHTEIKHTEIKYTCKDITVTRIDECTKTTFYFTHPFLHGNKTSKIWVTHSGFNDKFEAYLKFDIKWRRATLIILGGLFHVDSIGLDFSARYPDNVLEIERLKLDNLAYYINLVPELEIEGNTKKTKVKAEYKIDKNKRTKCGW